LISRVCGARKKGGLWDKRAHLLEDEEKKPGSRARAWTEEEGRLKKACE